MTTSHESHEDVLEFFPQMICYASRFILKIHVTAGDSRSDFQAPFEKFQSGIDLVLCTIGANPGNRWSTSATELLMEITFETDKDLKKFLQSKRKLETALNEIMDSQEDASCCGVSVQLFLATSELPEKLCEVTLASYRKCAALYAKSKVFDIGREIVMRAKVLEDALTDDDLPDLNIELAEVSAKWPILGLFLKMSQNTLDEIELENPGPASTKRRLSSMLSKWMSRYPDEARWSTLVAALVHSELRGTAREIAEKYGVSCPEIHLERENLCRHLREIGELMKKVESDQNTLTEKEELLKRSQAEGVVTSEAIESIKGSLKVAIDREKLLEAENAKVERQLAEKEQQLQEKERKLQQKEWVVNSALWEEVSQLRQRLRSNEDQLDAATKDASQFKQKLETANKSWEKAQELHSEISRLKEQLYMTRYRSRQVREQLVSTSDYHYTMEELNEYVAQQQQQEVHMGLKPAEKEELLRKKERELEVEREKNKREVELLERNISTLNLFVGVLRNEVSDLKEGLAAKQEELKASRDEIAKLGKDLSEKCAEQASAEDSPQRKLQILVHMNHQTVTLDVMPTDTIKSVKSKIHLKEGIPLDQQVLYRGYRPQHSSDKPLDNDKPLEYYHSKYYVVLRLEQRSESNCALS